MRLYLDDHYFISVIKQEDKYSCQVMELVHGMGMYSASINDEEQGDIVSCIVSDFDTNNLIVSSLEDIFKFHKEVLLQILQEA